MAGKKQFSTFVVDQILLGVEVEKVQEVIRYQKMTRVPLARPVVRGLINLRGQIVTAMDMRRRLGLRERAPDDLPMNVVIRHEDGAVSLLVDEIGDVLEVEDDAFELPPGTLGGEVRELIRGAYKLKGTLLIALDIEKVLNLDTAARPGA
ncbi:MAG TPA: chemotaxis protein CheW [Terriglobia bacterium]|nr:chemotaxis protein CheW [Terriglobia bacterium]